MGLRKPMHWAFCPCTSGSLCTGQFVPVAPGPMHWAVCPHGGLHLGRTPDPLASVRALWAQQSLTQKGQKDRHHVIACRQGTPGYRGYSVSQRQKVGRYTPGARESSHRLGASVAALPPGRLRRFWRCWWLPCTQGEHVQCHPACSSRWFCCRITSSTQGGLHPPAGFPCQPHCMP